MADRPAPLQNASFELIRAELRAAADDIRALAGLDPLTDDHAANPFIIILDVLSLFAEATFAALDNRALACFIVTARNLQDGTIAADSIGYDWEGVGPATADINLDFGAGGWAQDIVLLDGHKFLSNPDYLLDGDQTINAGTEEVTLPVRQVTRITSNFVSNGSQAQVFTMPNLPVVKGSASVLVDAVVYRVVKHLFELRAGEKGVAFRVNFKEEGILTTGDGINGEIIKFSAIIANTYDTSKGEDGRIGSGTIVDTVDPILDILTNPVTVTITQPFGSAGGTPRESLESMQFNGPRSLRTLEASISREDFTTNAEEVAGVLRALVLTNADDVAIAANVTLVLIAATPSGVGETTLFSDDHDDGNIEAGVWLEIAVAWDEVAGQMFGSTPTSIIRLDNFSSHFPIEFRSRCKALTATECRLVMLKASNLADYLYVGIDSDGAGNTTFRLGQYLSGVPTEVTSAETIDSQVLIDVVMRYDLTTGLSLEVDAAPILTFTPDLSFRDKFVPEYRGEISVDTTDIVVLVDYPLPTQSLLDDVEDHIATSRPTLVSHKVNVGQLQFLPLNLIIDMTPLIGFTVLQARTNIINALSEYLSLTRRGEDGNFANLPNTSTSLDEIYAVIRSAAGIDRAQITWPTDFDIEPAPREMLIPGELVWV